MRTFLCPRHAALSAIILFVSASAGCSGGPNDASMPPTETGDEDVAAPRHAHGRLSQLPSPELPRRSSRLIGQPAGLPAASSSSLRFDPTTSVNARVLVIAADGKEPSLFSIAHTLEYMGTPYDVWAATWFGGGQPITPFLASSPGHGNYEAVLLTTGALAYESSGQWVSAFDAAQWQELWDYESRYGVRQVSWYTYPTADYGFAADGAATSTDVSPLFAFFTPAGAGLWRYANPWGTLITSAWGYLASPGAPSDGGTVTPVLLDGSGRAAALIRAWPDGRENLAFTFDCNPYLLHCMHLGYGMIDWATRGVFIGERHAHMTAQVDDLFIDADEWPATDGNPGKVYRMTGDDLRALVAWQESAHADPLRSDFRIDFAFNGWGSTGVYPNDTLTPAVRSLQSSFKFINHTWDHENLDALGYTAVSREITRDDARALTLGLSSYSPSSLVTPDVSGLASSAAMRAARDAGVRYVVSDTSRPEQGTAPPNDGVRNKLQPSILQIPRRPTNLFYNVTTPDEWVAEYNSFYAPGGRWPTFDHPQTYAEIVDRESWILFAYMMVGEAYPWMFHQTNLRFFTAADGSKHSLLSDLLDVAAAKWRIFYVLPVRSPTMTALGQWMNDRMVYRASAAKGTITGHASITLTSPSAVKLPVTGLNTAGAELYGGEYIAHVPLAAGQSVTFALP